MAEEKKTKENHFPAHRIFFWSMASFIGGVLAASIFSKSGHAFWLAVFSFLALFVFLAPRQGFAGAAFSLMYIFGCFYFLAADANFAKLSAQLPPRLNGQSAFVSRVHYEDNRQVADLKLMGEETTAYRATLKKFPPLQYGDVVSVFGEVFRPDQDFSGYYKKEKIHGLLRFPQVEVLERGAGNFLYSSLFALRERVKGVFSSYFLPDEAKFLTGITLGKSASFSKEFKEKLSKTGTTHLVALSGYNVSIIAMGVSAVCSLFLARRASFLLSVLAIVGFVVMTGAEASVVRAGIMAIIVLVANNFERVYSFKNSVVAAAFLMVLANPFTLSFDIGFQLSFAALLGIVYLKPALESFFRAKADSGFLAWRENFFTTLSAQLAVFPILIISFGYISLSAIVPNILILTFIPLTMLGGLLVFVFDLFSGVLAYVAALWTRIFLVYELEVIDFFSELSIGLNFKNFSAPLSVVYYALLAGLIIFSKKYERRKNF